MPCRRAFGDRKFMNVIGLDPGNEQSAIVIWNGSEIQLTRLLPNNAILSYLADWGRQGGLCGADFASDVKRGSIEIAPLVIEKIASFGMPVGAEVFETVYWSGRFAEAYGADHVHRITRGEVKMHLCHSMRAKDGNVRQALIDRLGAPGTRKAPGVTHGVSKDLWSALAVAVTFWDQHNAPAVLSEARQETGKVG